ncbi:uncharacterized protein LOC135940489 [Cloeon dipterum]|uniref:uncharacterized protein LOC135940489 n=1 Tax=Cloeon dipterum TaxID=197152 RepID=UPI00321F6F9D
MRILVLFGIVLPAALAQVTDSDGDTGPDPRKIYDFTYQAPTSGQRVASDINGDVRGRYFYTDDMGIQRTVDYTAGKTTGFVVTSAVPDPNPANEASYYRASKPGAAYGTYEGTRGYLSSKLNGDGSYNFKLSSPHQSRSENKDVFGKVQGEYKFYDQEGKLHFVQYEAGPEIGYRVINTNDGKPTPVASNTQRRSGRSFNSEDEVLEGAHSEYYGSKHLKESAVKLKFHGQEAGAESGESDRMVRIAWNPLLKKPTGLEGKLFQYSAEEYERAPSSDAVDFFSGEQKDEDSEPIKRERKVPFIIRVPDPVFAASDYQVNPISPLSPMEHYAINSMKDYKKDAYEQTAYQHERFSGNDDIAFATDSGSRRWHSSSGGEERESLVNKNDIVHLRSRLTPYTPRLAQVISLD